MDWFRGELKPETPMIFMVKTMVLMVSGVSG